MRLARGADITAVPESSVDPPAASDRHRQLLLHYRVMAFTTATLLIILVFVGIPLQFAAGRPGVANVVGTVHGFLYLVYLYVAFRLTRALAVKKAQTALVLLAGTVPFAGFIAERKMTRRFENVAPGSIPIEPWPKRRSSRFDAASVRARWFSRRAWLLHLEVIIIAPACALAAWWQATRALSGNGVSWVYSVEWPVFAVIATVAWWHLIHEDPEAYRARKGRSHDDRARVAADRAAVPPLPSPSAPAPRVEPSAARLATALAVLVGLEFLLGIVMVFSVPFNRPTGSLPTTGTAVYLVHAIGGVALGLAAVALVVRVKGLHRTSRTVAWMGLTGVAMSGAGGLLTEAQSLTRFLGMTLMFLGAMVAGFSYGVPALLARSDPASVTPDA